MPIEPNRRREIWRGYRTGQGEARDEFAALLREAYDAVARKDIDTVLEGFEPDAEFVAAQDAPEQPTIQGHDALRRFYGDFLEAWDVELDPEVERAAGDSVVVRVRLRLLSRSASVPLDLTTGDLLTFGPRGKVVRWQQFQRLEDALEALERRG